MTGVMRYMFTKESLTQYVVLKATGATPHLLEP